MYCMSVDRHLRKLWLERLAEVYNHEAVIVVAAVILFKKDTHSFHGNTLKKGCL